MRSTTPSPRSEAEFAKVRLGATVDFVLVDIHAEATSEKAAVGVFADGRASLVAGTHSHVPTADARILPSGTAYQTDLGMCGDYNSIIGMDPEEPLNRFTRKVSKGRFTAGAGGGNRVRRDRRNRRRSPDSREASSRCALADF